MKKFLTIISFSSLLFLTGCSEPNINTEISNTSTTMEATNIAVIETTLGTIKAELYGNEAPETVKNFVTLAEEKKYDGTPFHRVIEGFMIQTGDFDMKNGMGGYSYKGPGTVIQDEFSPNLKNVKGALSMANRGPNTGGSQFFIVQAEATEWLDGKHAVFGQVIEGMDVVDAIATAETDPFDRPQTPINMISVTIE